jgi:hypothetical protein
LKNNEAAARYRRRQKEVQNLAKDEIRALEERNVALKKELYSVQEKINNIKSRIYNSSRRNS